MAEFLHTDCALCGMPETKVSSCEFDCDAVFCDDGETYSESCWNQQWECAGCGRQGCKSHFDGMFCHECRAFEKAEAKKG